MATIKELRHEAHRFFDPLWKYGEMTRGDAYFWLSFRTGIPPCRCHMRFMNREELRQTILICRSTLNYFRLEAA